MHLTVLLNIILVSVSTYSSSYHEPDAGCLLSNPQLIPILSPVQSLQVAATPTFFGKTFPMSTACRMNQRTFLIF